MNPRKSRTFYFKDIDSCPKVNVNASYMEETGAADGIGGLVMLSGLIIWY